MNRHFLKRLMVKGTVAYIAVFSLVLMVAMPAVALIAARNSVNRRSIINGEVTYKDIGKGQVRTSELGPKSVRYGKIADGAVRRNHIKNGAVTAAKINRTGLNADLLDGLNSTNFSPTTHDHDSNYIGVTGLQSINGTLTVSELNYDSPKTKKLSIIGAAFQPEASGEAYAINNANGTIQSNSSGANYFYAPVNLPDGAIVTELKFKVWDSQPAFDSEASLVKRGLGTMATVTPGGADDALWHDYVDGTILYNPIDNDNYYFVRLKLGTGAASMAGGVVITYTVSGP